MEKNADLMNKLKNVNVDAIVIMIVRTEKNAGLMNKLKNMNA